jgi:hypothetical protein
MKITDLLAEIQNKYTQNVRFEKLTKGTKSTNN